VTIDCDSSALVKVFIDEDQSDVVRMRLGAADVVATSALTYVEVRATFARLHRERRLTSSLLRTTTRQFDQQWPALFVLTPTDDLLTAAATLAETHGLRALDSIHLASFQQLLARTDDDLEIATFDQRLAEAARQLR
jgi:predicted nucleic acid-binding protein